MSTLNFTDHEWSTIANALRAAVEIYKEDAARVRDLKGGPRLAAAFEQQAKEATALGQRIQNEVGV